MSLQYGKEQFLKDANRLFPDAAALSKAKAASPQSKGRSYKDKSGKVVQDEYKLPEIRAEDKMLAMLGYAITTTGEKNPVLYREDFCGCCGSQHPNPDMLDMYNVCYACFNTLREPSALRKRFANIVPNAPLDVLYATYGDPFFCQLSYDVTEKVIDMVNVFRFKDRIQFKPSQVLSHDFGGGDPNPDNPKQLRIRYRMDGHFGTICLDVLKDNTIPHHIMIVKPKVRLISIVSAKYGFPKGVSKDGRMSYDATEMVQGLVDMTGGSFLFISSQQSVSRIFGDPCPGYPKDLRVQYEITGFQGTEVYDEDGRGHLKRKVLVETSPLVRPLIIVQSAFYGITPTGKKDHVLFLQKQLRKINAIEKKITDGLFPTPAESTFLSTKAAIIKEKEIIQAAEYKYADVTAKVQLMCDAGGTFLHWDKNKFDPNFQFGNLSKGATKLLEVDLMCYGHDSERGTDSKDMTSAGIPRNLITSKSARFVIPVRDNKYGNGYMNESLHFSTDFSAPLIHITRAIYGFFDDLSKTIDVTAEVQALVRGGELRIERDFDVDKYFINPCPGKRKQLKIMYSTRGFFGNIRVPVVNDLLQCKVELGFRPAAPRDEGEERID